MATVVATASKPSIWHADVQSLQQPDGSFAGDAWGEIDTRCSKLFSADTSLTQYKTVVELLDAHHCLVYLHCTFHSGYSTIFTLPSPGAVALILFNLLSPDLVFIVDCNCRFSYCALSCCSLLKRLDALNIPKAVDFLVACRNFDGGYGCTPGDHHPCHLAASSSEIECFFYQVSVATIVHSDFVISVPPGLHAGPDEILLLFYNNSIAII